MQTPTAPPVPAPVRAQLPPDSLTLRERWDWVRLQAWSWLLSSAHFLSSVSPAGWRLVTRTYHPVLDRIAAEHARIACAFAALDVPAYRHFVRQSATRPPKRLADFPETSKRGYVAAYDEADRCQEGELRLRGTVVDESSGSTGQPFNWARGARELRGIYRNTACYTRAVFRSDKLFVLNAYSMGAWATGTTTGAAMARIAMVKNTGPDLDKIVDTLEHFGPRFDYLVTAYPPFAKHLRDRLDAIGFPWGRYRISVFTGGEGMTEALRDYLEARFAKVRSGYGASDLTIGIGAETTFTVELRRRLRTDQDLRDALLGPGEQRLPMIFHYNPLETYLEVNERGELLCTVNSKHCLQPKLRYNIGDEALLHPLADVRRALRLDPARWREIQARAGEERMGCRCCSCSGARTPPSATWAPTSTRRTSSTGCTTATRWRPRSTGSAWSWRSWPTWSRARWSTSSCATAPASTRPGGPSWPRPAAPACSPTWPGCRATSPSRWRRTRPAPTCGSGSTSPARARSPGSAS